MPQTFRIRLNGSQRSFEGEPRDSLLSALRDRFRLTGAKNGCNIGACGACTVLLDGKAVRSCRIPLSELATDRIPDVTTIEGLERDGRLHPIQQAFIDCGAIQCGFCTPGMVLSAKALLDRAPDPSEEEIRKALAPNLCRCTGYQQIVQAVRGAARAMRGRRA